MTPILTATTLVATAASYALLCWVRPFDRCRHCDHGTRRTLILRRLRACRWCHGSTRRLRVGRRAYNYARTVASREQVS